MHIYTLRQNAIRAAKKAGLTAENVHPVDGGFVVRVPKPKATEKTLTEAAQDGLPRLGSKNRQLIEMLTRKGGSTMAELESTFGWKGPTVRCAVQRVTKAHGFVWSRVKPEDGGESRWTAARA